MTMAIMMAVEIKNNIQLRPEDDFSALILLKFLGGKIRNTHPSYPNIMGTLKRKFDHFWQKWFIIDCYCRWKASLSQYSNLQVYLNRTVRFQTRRKQFGSSTL